MTPQPKTAPPRIKGSDHFGYGHQIHLGKGGIWHSHGKYYHRPNTFWTGSAGERTPEELKTMCETILDDLKLYLPELFENDTRTSSPAPSRNILDTDLCVCSLTEQQCRDKTNKSAAQAREKVLEQLSDLNRYACQEYDEASCSDNEREMRIHLEYGNRTWGIIRSLRTGGEPR